MTISRNYKMITTYGDAPPVTTAKYNFKEADFPLIPVLWSSPYFIKIITDKMGAQHFYNDIIEKLNTFCPYTYIEDVLIHKSDKYNYKILFKQKDSHLIMLYAPMRDNLRLIVTVDGNERIFNLYGT